jgi:hypothetical protein
MPPTTTRGPAATDPELKVGAEAAVAGMTAIAAATPAPASTAVRRNDRAALFISPPIRPAAGTMSVDPSRC